MRSRNAFGQGEFTGDGGPLKDDEGHSFATRRKASTRMLTGLADATRDRVRDRRAERSGRRSRFLALAAALAALIVLESHADATSALIGTSFSAWLAAPR